MKKILFTILFGLTIFTQANCMFPDNQERKPEEGKIIQLNGYTGYKNRVRDITNGRIDTSHEQAHINNQNFEVYEDPRNSDHEELRKHYILNHKDLYEDIITYAIEKKYLLIINKEFLKDILNLKQRLQRLIHYSRNKPDPINNLSTIFKTTKSVENIIKKYFSYNTTDIELKIFIIILKLFYLRNTIYTEQEDYLTQIEDLKLVQDYRPNISEDDSYKQDIKVWLLSRAQDLREKITISEQTIKRLLYQINELKKNCATLSSDDDMEIDSSSDENENVNSENEK